MDRMVCRLEVGREPAVAEHRAAHAGAERKHHLEAAPGDDPQPLNLGVVEQAGWLAEAARDRCLQRIVPPRLFVEMRRSDDAPNKAVVLGDNYPALLRARRRREHWSDRDRELYVRHRWKVEGVHGEAKGCHGLARAVRRGLANMQIQAYLTAAAINLKRLAAWIAAILSALRALGRRHSQSDNASVIFNRARDS